MIRFLCWLACLTYGSPRGDAVIRDQDRLGLYAVGMLVLLAIAMCLSALFGAPSINGGHRHGAPRVTPGPVAGSAGSQLIERMVSEAGRRFDPARPVTHQTSRGVTQLETCHGSARENVIDAGSSPVASPTPKPGIAQQQESATRLASVALRVTGSAAARPGPIRGAE